jgi:diguanylate cyclase (GGDEF)-like protein/PAS domain S-box-containing protein
LPDIDHYCPSDIRVGLLWGSPRMLKDGKNASSFSRDALFAELDELRFMLILHEASVRATSIGQFEWNYENNRLGYCSKEYARLFGHHHVNIAGAQNSWDKFFTQVHPDDRDRYLKTCEQRHTRNSVTCEYRIVLQSGETRFVQETNIYTHPCAEVIRGNFGVIRDVSLQKQVESIMDSKNETIGKIHGLNDLGCFLYDEVHEKFLYVNKSLANIYGVEEDYLLDCVRSNNEDLEFVYKDDRESLSQVYWDVEMGDIWEAEYRMVRPDGEILWVREMGKSFLVLNGVEEQSIGVVLNISDRKKEEITLMKIRENLEHEVTERTSELDRTVKLLKSEVEEKKKIAAKLQHLANHDPLTGLPSIRLCMDRLSHALATADRSQENCAIMFLDVDDFKAINDNHGHQYGDEVLKIIAGRLQAVVREADTVARIGGDEFLIILSGVPETSIVERIASKLVEVTSQAVSIGCNDFNVGLSIGISLYPLNGSDADELIRAADKAMYQAKKNGRNCFRFAGT